MVIVKPTKWLNNRSGLNAISKGISIRSINLKTIVK